MAIKAIARSEVAPYHDKARRCLDVEGAEQARVDAERLRGILALPDLGQERLEPRGIAGWKAPQHGYAAGAAHVAHQCLQGLGRH